MSTTAVEVKGPNRALYRTAALAGSAIIWASLGYLALTYVPKYERQPLIEGPIVDTFEVPKPKPIDPPPPIKQPEVVKVQQNAPTANPTPTLTIRTPATQYDTPLTTDLPAGPVADDPVIFADPGPVTSGQEWREPIVLATPPTMPDVVEPPPVAKLVINPVRLTGSNPTFPMRALDRGVSGEVTLSFTVSPTGKVENINVTGENPGGYGFARAAREAIQSWTFQPQTIDGIAVAYPARYTISFKLED